MKITNLKLINAGNVKAKFNIEMSKWGGFQIRECSLIESNGKRWINFPQKQYESDGKKKYFSYCGFAERSILDAFMTKALSTLDEAIANEIKATSVRNTATFGTGMSMENILDEEVPF